MGSHPVLDVGVLVRTMDDGAAWELDADELDTDTFLAASLSEGTVTDVQNLVEVEWEQGNQDAGYPSGAVPHPEAGTATIIAWDPHLMLLPPPSNTLGGIRPGRDLIVYDKADSTVLWSGYVETIEGTDPGDDVARVTITAVDAVTRLVNAGSLPPDARPAEAAHLRASWVLATYLPGHPRIVDTAADSVVAATEVGTSPWDALLDCADADNGWVLILRDGTIVLRGNNSGEIIPVWNAVWEHEERTTAGRPQGGELRITAAPGTGETVFTVVLNDVPASGTPGPLVVGSTWWATLPEVPGQYFQAVVDSVTAAAPHTTVVLTSPDGQHTWPGQPTRGTLVRIRHLDFAQNPPGSVAWIQPDCGPVRVGTITHDLAQLRNRWSVRRRNPPDSDTPYSVDSHPSTGSYGVWNTTWANAPVPDAAGEARLAAFGAALHGEPGGTYAALHVNMTAARNTPELDTLRDLLYAVEQTNTILVHDRRRQVPVLVAGWSWTWTAAGGLTGAVSLSRSPLSSSTAFWFLGYVGASELNTTTVLA